MKMELSGMNEPQKTRRSLQEMISALVTRPSNFYKSSKMARSLQRLLEALSNKRSEQESFYDKLSWFKHRDVERFDRTVQIIDNLTGVSGIEPLKNYLDKTLRAETLEGYLRKETDVNNGISSLREIIDEGQNRLHNYQLELLKKKLNVSNDAVDGKNTSELDSIILREKSRLEQEVKDLSKLGNGQNKSGRVDKDEVISTGNMAILGKSIEISTYLNLRKPYNGLKKDASRILNGLEALTNQNGLKRFTLGRLEFLYTSLKYITPISIANNFNIPRYDISKKNRLAELAIRYGPAALGTVALAAAGYVLYQSVGFQVDTSVLSDIDASQTQINTFQMQLDLLAERYTNASSTRDLAHTTLQTAKDSMTHFKDIIKEYSIVEKGQGLWNMVKGLLTELNDGVSNVAGAVAKVAKANDMYTPTEFATIFPQHAYPHGSFLANIQGNPHLLQHGQGIDMKVLTQAKEALFQRGVNEAQSAYHAALQSVSGLESQITALNSDEISAQSSGIIQKISRPIDYKFSLTNPFKDSFTVFAAAGSVFLGSFGAVISVYKRWFQKPLDKLSPESQSPTSDYIALSTQEGIYNLYMDNTSYRENQEDLQKRMAKILQRVYDITFIGNERLTARQIAENLGNEFSRSFNDNNVHHYLRRIRKLTDDTNLTLRNQMDIKLYTTSLINSMHNTQMPEPLSQIHN